MLPGSKIALFNFALVRQATLSLQEQLDTFAPAQPANSLTISCQTNLLRNETQTSDIVLNSSTLGRAATIVRNGRHVLDIPHFQSGSGEGANGRFASGTWSLDPHFHAAHAMITGSIGHAHCGLLSGKGGAFARPLEAQRTSAGPADHPAIGICYGNVGVIERRLHVNNPDGDDALFFLLK